MTQKEIVGGAVIHTSDKIIDLSFATELEEITKRKKEAERRRRESNRSFFVRAIELAEKGLYEQLKNETKGAIVCKEEVYTVPGQLVRTARGTSSDLLSECLFQTTAEGGMKLSLKDALKKHDELLKKKYPALLNVE